MRGTYKLTLLSEGKALLEQIRKETVVSSVIVDCDYVEINCDGVTFDIKKQQFIGHGLVAVVNKVVVFDY